MKKIFLRLTVLCLCLMPMLSATLLSVGATEPIHTAAASRTDEFLFEILFFYIFFSIGGVLIPGALSVFSLLWVKRKHPRTKSVWYAIAASSGLLALTSILIILLASI